MRAALDQGVREQAEAMSAYSPQEIQRFEDFIGRLRSTMDALLAHEYRDGGPTA
ncbi:hypothetical protein ACFXA0_34915 [Streptomyces cyaneofuscatus]|uniref:hypothetical protein n=1 Tax=Streptomyces cyaneofuscatus TaxID=66883 RepID=UPI0036BBC911